MLCFAMNNRLNTSPNKNQNPTAFITAVFPPTRGGMATVAFEEARALSATHDVTVFTLAMSPRDVAHDSACGVVVKRLTGFPRISFGGFTPQLLWYLWRGKFEVVYVHAPAYGLMEIVWLWKLITGRRLVITLHMDPVGTGWRQTAFRFLRISFFWLLSRADYIRVSTESLRRSAWLKKYSKRVRVIPFGVSEKFFTSHDARSEHPTFLFVGRLARTHYFKGVSLLLKTFATVRAKYKNAKLIIVGDGDERARYEAEARKLGVAPAVEFLGAVSDEVLPALYGRAHATVLPSIDASETFGLVLLESCAAGTPVIASNWPGVDNLVQNGVTGVLIEPGSEEALAAAMLSVAEDPEIWRLRGKAAEEVACNYGEWKNIVQQLDNLLYS